MFGVSCSLGQPCHLAGILVHIEAGYVVLRNLLPHLGNDVLGQLGSHEGFARPTGPWEDDASVLHQQVEVPLDDGFRNQRVEHQAVNAALLYTCAETARGGWELNIHTVCSQPGFLTLKWLFHTFEVDLDDVAVAHQVAAGQQLRHFRGVGADHLAHPVARDTVGAETQTGKRVNSEHVLLEGCKGTSGLKRWTID